MYIGIKPSIGLLLQGPTGCGKTSLALAIAGELGLPFFKVIIALIHVYFTRMYIKGVCSLLHVHKVQIRINVLMIRLYIYSTIHA